MSDFECPCQTCPKCDYEIDDEYHPEDGLAYCPRCESEWWVHVGPELGEKKCPKSREELLSWRDYDNAFIAAQKAAK